MADELKKGLIISNNAELTDSVKSGLCKYRIDNVESLFEARIILEDCEYSILIVDITLREKKLINGLKMHSSETPILALVLNEADGELALADGAIDVIIQKEVEPRLLRKTVDSAISRHHLLKELEIKSHKLKMVEETAKLGTWYWKPESDFLILSDSLIKMLSLNLSGPIKMSDFLCKIGCFEPDAINERLISQSLKLDSISVELCVPGTNSVREYRLSGNVEEHLYAEEPEYSGTLQDITELKITEQDLESKERFLNLTNELSAVGGWEYDVIKDKVSWTRTTRLIHGVPMDYEPTSEESVAFYAPEDRNLVQKHLDGGIHSNLPFRYEATIISASGKRIRVAVVGQPIIQEGKLLKMSGIIQDISDTHEYLEELRMRATMLDSVGESVIAIDLEGNIIFCNRAAEELYLFNRKNVINTPLIELNISLVPKEEAQGIFNILKQGKGYSGEFLMQNTRGRKFSVWSTNSPIIDANGKVVAFLAVSRDISQQREYVDKLIESEERFRRIFEYSPVGKAYGDHESGLWLDCNTALLKMLGYTKAEFTKLTYKDITPPEWAETDNHQAKNLETTGVFGPYEKEYFRKDGSKVKVMLTGFGLEDKEGKIKTWTHVVDLSVLHEKTRALEISEARFKEYVESASDVIVTFDSDGHFSYISPNVTRIVGFSLNELAKKPIADFLHPKDVFRAKKYFERCFAKPNNVKRISLRVKHRLNFYKWVQANGSVRVDKEGFKHGILVVRDIDKERKSQQKILDQNRKLKEIAFLQSHILRRPLANILGLLEIDEMKKASGKLKELLELLSVEARGMDATISEIIMKSTDITEISHGNE